ncbi:MAG TPA: hypothetical protein VJ521_05200 [Acidobacteriota bacterium]|nr:hypothetical protein [Acidobacteriota bacterium]
MNHLRICALILGAALTGCAGTKMNANQARKAIASELRVSEKQVQIDRMSQMGETVLAEGSLRLTFVLQKEQTGQWKVLKIKRSSGNWQSPEEFFAPPFESSLSRSLESAFLAELNEDN